MMDAVAMREPSGIREILDINPVAGEQRKGSRRFWTGREEKLLREHYPASGVTGCLVVLPGRTASSIYNRAGYLGLRVPSNDGKVHQRQRWETTEQIDALIVRTYQKAPTKGDVMRCASIAMRPRWWISKRAQALGLAVSRFKEPTWSEIELDLIASNAHKHSATLRRMLRSRGFARTETAIVVRLKKLGADRTDPDHLNANQLASVMGVDRKTVAAWIAKGWLKATRRESTDTDDFWWIHRRDIRRFVIDNVATVDLRKVDKFWFVDLLAERGAG